MRMSSDIDGLRVLVVEDEPDSRELLVMVLEQCRVQVTSAASANEALEAMKGARFDVILSDIGLPEEDGYVLMQKIRRLPPDEGGTTPAVALTAFARPEDRTRALLAGYNMHMAKPIDPAELLGILANVAGRSPVG